MQIKYQGIILRDFKESDIEDKIRWNTAETQWALWDGPWEMEKKLAKFNEEEERRKLRQYLEKPPEGHRWSFEIDTAEGVHIGSVNTYCIDEDCNPHKAVPPEEWGSARWAVGIDIYESSYWSGGYGTKALTAFLRYSMEDGYTNLYTQTWSGNVRMIGLAHKLGFREYRRKEGLREVRGGIYDGLTFSLDAEAFSEHCKRMENATELELKVPSIEDMWFAQTLQEDPETMSYNAGWDIHFAGYHPATGCIDLPREKWPEKHVRVVGHEPNCYYAFVREKKSGRFLCEVNFHYTEEKQWWDMGVLVYAPYRGQGYGSKCLELLLHHAFVVCGIERLHNDFEETRTAAMAIHQKAGFRRIGESSMLRFGEPTRIIDLMLTREEYFSLHPELKQ